MVNSIHISDPEGFQKKKDNIINDGVDNLMVLSDFDRTLTYGSIDGRKTPSMIAILRENGNYLGGDYAEKASILAQKYKPIEFDPKIDQTEKERAMTDWWSKHLELLVEKKLSKDHLRKIVDSRKISFRDKAGDVFKFLNEYNIPLIVISASGLGDEAILMFFRKEDQLYPNIFILSNSFIWNNEGNVVGYEEAVIHSLNKDKISIKDCNLNRKIKDRKNIILLGDTLDDVKMADNFYYENLIKICFLNDEAVDSFDEYKRIYDVLILNDSSMDFVNNFLKSYNLS